MKKNSIKKRFHKEKELLIDFIKEGITKGIAFTKGMFFLIIILAIPVLLFLLFKNLPHFPPLDNGLITVILICLILYLLIKSDKNKKEIDKIRNELSDIKSKIY